MGIGDEIMVTGEAKRLSGGRFVRYAVWDVRKGGIHRWHEMWEGNPRIAAPGQIYHERLVNHGGARPYIVEKQLRNWLWKPYAPEPGEIFLKPPELQFAAAPRGAVVVQPTIKQGASPNKQWPFRKWQALLDAMPTVDWVQVGTGEEPRLKGARFLTTRNFREACGAVAGARAAVLHEGGLHHAAAALGTRTVVLFGGYISPRCTGYTAHTNMFVDSTRYPLGCGMRTECAHCLAAMDSINHSAIARKLEELFA